MVYPLRKETYVTLRRQERDVAVWGHRRPAPMELSRGGRAKRLKVLLFSHKTRWITQDGHRLRVDRNFNDPFVWTAPVLWSACKLIRSHHGLSAGDVVFWAASSNTDDADLVEARKNPDERPMWLDTMLVLQHDAISFQEACLRFSSTRTDLDLLHFRLSKRNHPKVSRTFICDPAHSGPLLPPLVYPYDFEAIMQSIAGATRSGAVRYDPLPSWPLQQWDVPDGSLPVIQDALRQRGSEVSPLAGRTLPPEAGRFLKRAAGLPAVCGPGAALMPVQGATKPARCG